MNTLQLLNRQLAQIPQLRELPNAKHPDFKLWHQLTKEIVRKCFDDTRANKLPDYEFWPHHVGPWEDWETREALNEGFNDAEAFLKGLISEVELFGEHVNTEKIETTKKLNIDPRSFGNFTISGGTVVFGDGNRITQVSVKQLIDALSEDIQEKIPESEEKKNILTTLKNLTDNETFASVSGAFIGELLKRVTTQ